MAKDFLLDDADGDLLVRGGDLVIGAGDQQHLYHVLLSHPGHFRQAPLTGAAVGDWLEEDSDTGALRAAIEQQVVQDGARIQALTVRPAGDFDLTATYDA